MRSKILITDGVHPILISGLENKGHIVDYLPDFNPEDLLSVIGDYTGIIINSKIKVTAEVLDRADRLQFIGRLGSGLEIIDLAAAKKKGVLVFNSPEGNRNAVSEHALGMLLVLSNNLIQCDREVRKRIWNRDQNRGFELEGKTIGIIGFGNTGQAFAKKLSSWALELIYYDPYVRHNSDRIKYISKVSLEVLQSKADIISLHVPLNDETNKLINTSFISKCKTGLIIVNTSRGHVVDTKDLISALKNKRVSGACLDVFENEKPHHFTSEENQLYNELYAMENVVLSPHVAGWTRESLMKIAEVLLAKINAI